MWINMFAYIVLQMNMNISATITKNYRNYVYENMWNGEFFQMVLGIGEVGSKNFFFKYICIRQKEKQYVRR